MLGSANSSLLIELRGVILKKLGRIISDIVLSILVVIALIIVIPNIFGVRTLAVLSGSMSPSIPTGSMVFVQPVNTSTISIGDTISYTMNERGTIITHRVYDIPEEGSLRFIVKGDAVENPDAKPVPADNVVGVVKFHIPVLGFMLGFVINTYGKIIVGTVVIALILLVLLLNRGKPGEKEEKPVRSPRGAKPVRGQNVYTRQQREYQGAQNYYPQQNNDYYDDGQAAYETGYVEYEEYDNYDNYEYSSGYNDNYTYDNSNGYDNYEDYTDYAEPVLQQAEEVRQGHNSEEDAKPATQGAYTRKSRYVPRH